jgi:hypothetical protein
VYRLTERLGYHHVADLLGDMPNSAELTGWFAYLRVDDQVRADWMTHAIIKAFNAGSKQQPNTIDGEQVIDTTTPEFRQHFQGFTNTKPQPPRSIAARNTEIKMG